MSYGLNNDSKKLETYFYELNRTFRSNGLDVSRDWSSGFIWIYSSIYSTSFFFFLVTSTSFLFWHFSIFNISTRYLELEYQPTLFSIFAWKRRSNNPNNFLQLLISLMQYFPKRPWQRNKPPKLERPLNYCQQERATLVQLMKDWTIC